MAKGRREFDVIIVGGGPAGLSAALVLGRSRRSVLVIDAGNPRNARTRKVHALYSRDGIAPARLQRLAKDDLRRYDVTVIARKATQAKKLRDTFLVRAGEEFTSRALLIATGVRDRLPSIEGVERFYGSSVHHCPYCDGWEWRDKRIAILARSRGGVQFAMRMKQWSKHITLLTNGPFTLTEREQLALAKLEIVVRKERVLRLQGEKGKLAFVEFARNEALAVDALFFSTGQDPNIALAAALGAELSKRGQVVTTRLQETCVEMLYVAGDAARDIQFVVVAAAEGAKAAVAINEALIQRDQRNARRVNVRS